MFYVYIISQFSLGPFHVLNRHMWSVTPVLENIVLDGPSFQLRWKLMITQSLLLSDLATQLYSGLSKMGIPVAVSKIINHFTSRKRIMALSVHSAAISHGPKKHKSIGFWVN